MSFANIRVFFVLTKVVEDTLGFSASQGILKKLLGVVITLTTGCLGFMDHPNVKRITKYVQLSDEMRNSNRVMALYLHDGSRCRNSIDEVESCKDLESVLKDFTEDNVKLAQFFVYDCSDAREEV